MTGPRPSGRRGQLALMLQDALTNAARVRTGRQLPKDALAFRSHAKQLFAQADRAARLLGYGDAEVKLAVYAVVVFLDESILNADSPTFADWPRRPLQEEIFGENIGGHTFFENLRGLLARENTEDVADVLEVYQLCLILGFRGGFAAGGGDIQALMSAAGEKIERIRTPSADLSPAWRLPAGERLETGKDPWLPRLQTAAVAAFGLAALLYAVFLLVLRSGVSRLAGLTD